MLSFLCTLSNKSSTTSSTQNEFRLFSIHSYLISKKYSFKNTEGIFSHKNQRNHVYRQPRKLLITTIKIFIWKPLSNKTEKTVHLPKVNGIPLILTFMKCHCLKFPRYHNLNVPPIKCLDAASSLYRWRKLRARTCSLTISSVWFAGNQPCVPSHNLSPWYHPVGTQREMQSTGYQQ